jgi:LysM repeat protein
MMRFRSLSKFRSYLLPAVAAIILAVGPVACSSTGEEEPTPALEGAASGEESSSGNAANDAAAGENANANANTEAANTAKPEGEAASSNNPIGNELNNAIGGDSSAANASADAANAAGSVPDGGAALNGDAASNANANALAGETSPAAAPPSDNSAVASAADANTSNPFAAGANAAAPVPTNAAPEAPADTAAPASASEAPATQATATTSSEATGESEAAPSGPTSLPEMGSKMAYYVMRGDTLGAISQKIYGSRGKWKALQSENGLVDANKIYPGDVIYFTLNEASKAFAEKYEMGSRQIYTVSQGDSLSRLAAKFYGTQGAWRALWKENPQILNPDRIRVGMVLSYRAANKVALKDENGIEMEDERADGQAAADADNENEPTGELLTASAE